MGFVSLRDRDYGVVLQLRLSIKRARTQARILPIFLRNLCGNSLRKASFRTQIAIAEGLQVDLRSRQKAEISSQRKLPTVSSSP